MRGGSLKRHPASHGGCERCSRRGGGGLPIGPLRPFLSVLFGCLSRLTLIGREISRWSFSLMGIV